jgi:hypothetical protein
MIDLASYCSGAYFSASRAVRSQA